MAPELTLVFGYGDRLRKTREIAGKSREEMADLLDTTRATIRKWELGLSIPRDTIALAKRWAEITSVRWTWIATGESSEVGNVSSPCITEEAGQLVELAG